MAFIEGCPHVRGGNGRGGLISQGLICTKESIFGTQQSGLYRGVSSRQGWQCILQWPMNLQFIEGWPYISGVDLY